MVFITIGTGIGAGIIIDGAVSGSARSVGRIGNMLPDREFLGNATRTSERWKPSLPAPALPSVPGEF
jgi:hypothetical protein